LLESSDYTPAMYVTNTTWELADTVKFYEKRGNCENYIKETKYDMNIGSLKMKSFSRKGSVFPDHDAGVQHIPAIYNG